MQGRLSGIDAGGARLLWERDERHSIQTSSCLIIFIAALIGRWRPAGLTCCARHWWQTVECGCAARQPQGKTTPSCTIVQKNLGLKMIR